MVAWLDVDSFKSVNDNAGFAAGDDLIRLNGQALADRLVDPQWTIAGLEVSISLAALACGVDSVASYREANTLPSVDMAACSWSSDR